MKFSDNESISEKTSRLRIFQWFSFSRFVLRFTVEQNRDEICICIRAVRQRRVLLPLRVSCQMRLAGIIQKLSVLYENLKQKIMWGCLLPVSRLMEIWRFKRDFLFGPSFPPIFYSSRFLEFFPPGIGFVLQAIAIRTVHATANAFVIVSTFAYIALEFPHRVARIFVSCFLYHHQLLHLGFSWRSILQFKLIKSLLLSSKIYSDIFIAGIIYECYLLSSFQASKLLFFF